MLDDPCRVKHALREGVLDCARLGGVIEMRLHDHSELLRRGPGCSLLYKHALALCRSHGTVP